MEDKVETKLGLRRYIPNFLYEFADSPAFEEFCRTSFDSVDVDKDGLLDFKELYLAILKLYDVLNHKLPCHLKIPNNEQVAEMFKKHDKNESGKLEFPEYLDVCKDLVGAKNFTDSLLFKAVVVVGLKVVLFPLLARGIKAGLKGCGVPTRVVDKVPTSAVALGIELCCKSSNLTLALPL